MVLSATAQRRPRGRTGKLEPVSVQNVALFDPADVVWDRVSERLITMRLLLVIGMNAIAAIAVALVYLPALTRTWRTPILVALRALSIWERSLIGHQVRAMGYVERAVDRLIRKGIFLRELVEARYGHI